MKYKIDSLILDATKTLITSSISTLKELRHSETDYNRKDMLDATIKCLQQAYINLDEHANKPRPIRKIGITTK